MAIPPSFLDELEKIAQTRSYAKDFAAGVDPFGNWTTNYGVQDAGISDKDARLRRAVGTAGGVIGGAIAVPAAITGAIGATKGFVSGGLRGAVRGGVHGAHKLFTDLARGSSALRGVKAVQGGGRMSSAQARRLHSLGKSRAGINNPVTNQITPAHVQKGVQSLDPKRLKELRGRLQDEVVEGAATLGLSGAIGGGAAYLGYGKGRTTGKAMSQKQRDAVAEGVASGGKRIN